MDMSISTGTVYSVPYHTVQPLFGLSSWRAMEEWCTEVYGRPALDGVWTPGRRWYANNQKFWFLRESDLTMFILRWS
jgi:hypothetical protein